MPIMDGYEAATKIKDLYNLNNKLFRVDSQKNFNQMTSPKVEIPKKPLIVAVTAYLDEKTRSDCIKSGFDIVLEQPLTIEKIDKYILKKLSRNSSKIQLANLQVLQEEEEQK